MGWVSIPLAWAWAGSLIDRFDERMLAQLRNSYRAIIIEVRAVAFMGRGDKTFTEIYGVAFPGIVEIVPTVYEVIIIIIIIIYHYTYGAQRL